MGVNVSCSFPWGTRIGDVGKAVAKILGCEVVHKPIGGSNAIFAYTTRVKFRCAGDTMPECCDILIDLTNVDNPAAKSIRKSDGDVYYLFYLFEGRNGPSISPKSTAAKIAMSAALVKLFGGTIDFNDSDDTDVNLNVRANPDRLATDGEAWNRWNQAIIDLKPLTQKDLDRYAKWAAY